MIYCSVILQNICVRFTPPRPFKTKITIWLQLLLCNFLLCFLNTDIFVKSFNFLTHGTLTCDVNYYRLVMGTSHCRLEHCSSLLENWLLESGSARKMLEKILLEKCSARNWLEKIRLENCSTRILQSQN